MILRCQPVSGYWDPASAKGNCYSIKLFIKFALINTGMSYYSLWPYKRTADLHSGFNIFTNVALAVLPVPIVWSLQMKMRTRIYIVGILSLGWV